MLISVLNWGFQAIQAASLKPYFEKTFSADIILVVLAEKNKIEKHMLKVSFVVGSIHNQIVTISFFSHTIIKKN